MGRAVRRAILWGTMTVGGGKRRSYVFRVDPAGLLAIRIGNPLSWFAFFLIVLLFFLALPPTPFALGPILGGGAAGMAVLGLVDRAIARAAATQPAEQAIKSPMNAFLQKEDLAAARFEEGAGYTFLELTSQGRLMRLAISRPRPPAARAALRPLMPG